MSDYPIIGMVAYERELRVNPSVVYAGMVDKYKNAVLEAGGLPLLIPQNLDAGRLAVVLDLIDGLLLPGGGDIAPERYGETVLHEKVYGVDVVRDETELVLVREAVARDMPLLAICRGHQVLNVALGGTLWQDVESQMPHSIEHVFFQEGLSRDYLAHDVMIEAGSCLASLVGKTAEKVNSLHHQGVKELGEGLVASAWTRDELVEGIEYPDKRFVVGVQWHPEEIVENVPSMRGLFGGLVDASRR